MFSSNGRKLDAETISIGNIKDVDECLLQVFQADRRLHDINGEISVKVSALKSKFTGEADRLAKFIKAAGEKIEEYCTAHKEKLFENSRSLKLVNGEVGFRISKAVQVADDTLEKLQELGENTAIEIKHSVRKTVLAKWPKEKLAAVNASIVNREKFYYKLFAVQAQAVTVSV